MRPERLISEMFIDLTQQKNGRNPEWVERVENGSPNSTIEYFPKIVIKQNRASYQYCAVAFNRNLLRGVERVENESPNRTIE
jgi:hypothetical protein